MPTPSTAQWYPSAAHNMFAGDIQSTDTFKIMLLDASGTYDDDDDDISDVDGDEVSGTGYTAGGEEVTVTASVVSGETRFAVGAGVWAGADFTFRGAVLYSETSGALLLHVYWDAAIEADGTLTIAIPDPLPAMRPMVLT